MSSSPPFTRRGDPENPNSPAFANPTFDAPFPGGPGLTHQQAIRAITINRARFLRTDDKISSIQRGKLADLIILEKDFFKVPGEELGRNRVLITVVGGEVVYVADDASDFSFGNLDAKFPNHEDPVSKRLAREGLTVNRSLTQSGLV